jgi:hypothetical protein
VEIIKKKLPKATFVDFHGCGSYSEIGITAVSTGFPFRRFLSFCFFFFLCEKDAAPGSPINDDRRPG